MYRNNTSSDLFEDEVDGSLFSKELFKEFIIPYVKQLEKFYGGISYYHSCGKLTTFLPDLAEINIQNLMQISPWTDLSKAVEMLPENIVLQRALHPVNDVSAASEEWMRENLKKIINESKGRKIEIWADALYEGSWNTVGKVKKLIEIFRELTA